MAYADSISTAYATMDAVAALLNGLTVAYGSASNATIRNTTSASYTDRTDASVTVTVGTGEICIVYADMSLSHSNATVVSDMRVVQDGSLIGTTASWTSVRADTSGRDISLSKLIVVAPAAGAHTYKIQWETASNTVYSLNFGLYCIVVQNT